MQRFLHPFSLDLLRVELACRITAEVEVLGDEGDDGDGLGVPGRRLDGARLPRVEMHATGGFQEEHLGVGLPKGTEYKSYIGID